eukprot:gene8204-10962_t
MKNHPSPQRLHQLFSAQKAALSAAGPPSLAVRLERLGRLRRMVIDNRQNFRVALAEDFGSHHPWLVDLMETGPVIARVKYIEANLSDWMQPRTVEL